MKPARPAPDWRALHGIVLLDKPTGLSSNQALQKVRHLLRAEKGGHTGALDPLATGMLPLCLGEATKIAGLLLGERKAYETEVVLGTETDSGDSDGQVTGRFDLPDSLPAGRVLDLLASLTGRILQVPPMYSALKRDGEPLYRKARRGETLELEPREVEVHGIELLRLAADRLVLRIDCGSGTYVRSLVRDLGRGLGCGAHVAALRRLWVEPFRGIGMVSLDRIAQAAAEGDAAVGDVMLPLEAGLGGLARVDLAAPEAARWCQGQAVPCDLRETAPEVAVFGASGRALGLGSVSSGWLRPRRRFLHAG